MGNLEVPMVLGLDDASDLRVVRTYKDNMSEVTRFQQTYQGVEIWGEQVVSVVVTTGAVSENDLLDICRKGLEPHSVPDTIIFADALPRNRTGKVVLKEVKQMVMNAEHKISHDHMESLADDIIRIASETFKVDPSKLTMNDSSKTVDGWDSMAHLNLIIHLEEHFNVQFTTREVMNLETLQDAEKLILEKK